VVSIEAKKRPDGSYEAYIDCGRERTGVEVFGWAREVAELGAGEIIVTSIDREGTGNGFDLELTRGVADAVRVPVIACGGAGEVGHVLDVLTEGHVDAVSLSSVLHYHFVRRQRENGTAEQRAAPGLSGGRHGSSKVADSSLPELKRFLEAHGLECRQLPQEVATDVQ